jgi:nitroreductase
VSAAAIDHARLNAMPFGDVVFSQRSIRRYRPEPVPIPMEDLQVIMEAAVRAPNGGNAQPARFVLITDRARIEKMASLYKDAWWAKRRDEYGWRGIDDIPADEKNLLSAARLAETMDRVSAIVLAFGRARNRFGQAENDATSVVPAIQNLMLAARALGIGSIPTRLHPDVLERVYDLFGVPEGAYLHLMIPLGYPASPRAFGLSRRLPTSETVFLNHWGDAVPWA